MSKTIKISETTYAMLEDRRDKRETFDQAVTRMIRDHDQLKSYLRDLAGDNTALERTRSLPTH